LKLVKRFLGDLGFQVSTASSAEISLGMLEQNRSDLILLDLLMPGMNGMRFLESLPPESEQPLIIMSVQGDIFTKLGTFELGAVDYIAKPFSRAALVARIEANLRGV
tara:strand:+ start:1204 stop:1524 length:321 start_codon:yes stop_codon:yes gene_type:complete